MTPCSLLPAPVRATVPDWRELATLIADDGIDAHLPAVLDLADVARATLHVPGLDALLRSPAAPSVVRERAFGSIDWPTLLDLATRDSNADSARAA
jgi:hypothetical protein